MAQMGKATTEVTEVHRGNKMGTVEEKEGAITDDADGDGTACLEGGAVVVGKWGWKARQGRLSSSYFPRQHVRNGLSRARFLTSVYLCGLCGCIFFCLRKRGNCETKPF